MDRLSVRLTDAEFRSLDSLGGKTRSDNLRLALKYSELYRIANGTDFKHKDKKKKINKEK